MTAAQKFVSAVNDAIINPLLALIFVAALFMFLYGGFQFVVSAGSDTARADGRRHMLWGVIGMVIMVSVFTILNIGLNTFNVQKDDIPADLPLNRIEPQGTR